MKQLRRYAAVLVTFLLGMNVIAQQVHPISEPSPATLRQMLIAQPNYSASQRFLFSEGFGGFGAKSQVAKLRGRFREETEDQIIIHEHGKPSIRIMPKKREYSEFTVAKPEEFATEPEDLAKKDDVTFKLSGIEELYGHKVFKVEAMYADKKLESIKMTFYIAPGLKNLVVKREIKLGDKVAMITVLEDVSLDVSEKMFEIPVGYKKVRDPYERIR
jgi:hypothetical protein